MRISKRALIAVLVAAILALPAAAAAHVTLQPETAPAGGFARFDVRVPNERDDATTAKVEVQMPDGFVFASYEPVAGWKAQVKTEKLDQPIETDDGPVDEQVNTITWTATDPAAAIQPGQFRDFGISVGLPDQYAAGDALTFPAIQTYDDGEVVRWIGAPDSDEPAPEVTLTAAEEEHGHAAAEEEPTATAGADDSDDDASGAPTWLAILALVVGAAGLVAGGLALRERRTA